MRACLNLLRAWMCVRVLFCLLFIINLFHASSTDTVYSLPAQEQAASERKVVASIQEELEVAKSSKTALQQQIDASAGAAATDVRRTKAESSRLQRELDEALERIASAEEQARNGAEAGATLADQLRESAEEVSAMQEKLIEAERVRLAVACFVPNPPPLHRPSQPALFFLGGRGSLCCMCACTDHLNLLFAC